MPTDLSIIVPSYGGDQVGSNGDVSAFEALVMNRGGRQRSGGTPAPSFTVQPAISPSSGTVGAVFTVSPGTITNGSVSGYQWRLGGAAISGATSASYTSAAAGTLTCDVIATGPGGSTTATAAGVSVAAAVSGPYLPTTSIAPTHVYGVRRMVAAYSGPLFTLTRASDSATMNVYPKSGSDLPDYSAIDTWANGSDVTVASQFDQIGSINITQSTVANQPRLSALSAVGGIRPLTMDGYNTGSSTTATPKFLSAAGFNSSRRAFGSLQVLNPRNSYASRGFLELSDGSATSYANFYQNQSGPAAVGRGFAAGSWLRNAVAAYGIGSDASGVYFFTNGTSKKTLSANTAATNANGTLRIGGTTIGTGYVSSDDHFCTVIFEATPTDADQAALGTWAGQAFSIAAAGTKRLVYSESSLGEGWGSTVNQTPLFQMALGDSYESFDMSLGGRSLATQYANRATDFSLFKSGVTNVYMIDAPSNDLASATISSDTDAQNWASDLFGTTSTGKATAATLPLVQAAISAGFKVVVPTILARSSVTGNKEAARKYYNALVRSQASANNYAAADRAVAQLEDTTNATYFSDGTHLTNAGYAIMAGIEKSAITSF